MRDKCQKWAHQRENKKGRVTITSDDKSSGFEERKESRRHRTSAKRVFGDNQDQTEILASQTDGKKTLLYVKTGRSRILI